MEHPAPPSPWTWDESRQQYYYVRDYWVFFQNGEHYPLDRSRGIPLSSSGGSNAPVPSYDSTNPYSQLQTATGYQTAQERDYQDSTTPRSLPLGYPALQYGMSPSTYRPQESDRDKQRDRQNDRNRQGQTHRKDNQPPNDRQEPQPDDDEETQGKSRKYRYAYKSSQ